MKFLRQYIRQVILESSINPKISKQLARIKSENLVVSARWQSFSRGFGTCTVEIAENAPRGGNIIARLQAKSQESAGNCNGAFIISSGGVFSRDGLGPLVYDVAFELAELAGFDGLGPDPREVSAEAKAVWDYYLRNRPDVISKQRDFFESPVTEPTEDDCLGQNAAADSFPGGRRAAYTKTKHIRARYFDDPEEGYTVPEEYSQEFIDFYFDPGYSLSKTFHKRSAGTPIIDFLRANLLLHPWSAADLNRPYTVDEVKKAMNTNPDMYHQYFKERKYVNGRWEKIELTDEEKEQWILDNWVNPK